MDTLGIYRTRGLGCLAEIVLTDPDSVVGTVDIVHEELDQIDRAASRFRPDAEIALVHRAEGRPISVSPCLFEAVAVALRVAVATGGAVDPTVGGALNRLGYDRDFASIGAGIPGDLPKPAPVPGWRSIELDRASRTVRVPAGTTSMDRLRLCTLSRSPFFSRLVMCLWTVASDFRSNPRAISSKDGE